MKKTISAISFYHNGERVIIKANNSGRFRVPVTEAVNGNLKTRLKSLSARQFVDHEIIKNCDPTLYLETGEKVRVFQGGDPSYLPAQIEGLILKHDSEIPESSIRNGRIKKKFNKSSKSNHKFGYEQAHFDIYGAWPYGDDDGNAD